MAGILADETGEGKRIDRHKQVDILEIDPLKDTEETKRGPLLMLKILTLSVLRLTWCLGDQALFWL